MCACLPTLPADAARDAHLESGPSAAGVLSKRVTTGYTASGPSP